MQKRLNLIILRLIRKNIKEHNPYWQQIFDHQ